MEQRATKRSGWLGGCLLLTFLLASFVATGSYAPILLPLQFQLQLPRAAFAASLTDLSIVIGRETTFFVKQHKAHWRNWDPTLNLRFAWTTTQPGTASAIYQVATVPFPSDTSHALDPPGLVTSGSAGAPPISGERRLFSIDLRTFAPVPPGETRPDSSSGATAAAPVIGPIVRAPTTALPSIRAFRQPETVPPPSSYLTVVTYYVRVVTLNSNGAPIGVPSPPVTITYGELPDNGAPSVTYHGQTVLRHPAVAVTGYVPIQTEDPQAMYHYLVIRDLYVPGFGAVYRAGQPLDFTPHENDPGFWASLWDSIGEVFSNIAGFFENAVNWCATAYEDMKGYAIDAAVMVAGEDARGLLTVGLEIGLAAMGIPPSIPDYDELTGLGRDYLVQAAADYTGLPPEATAVAVDAFLEEATRRANGGGNPNVWLKPDPAFAYRPAYLNLVARNSTAQSTDPVYARISVQVPTMGNADLFASAYVYIPVLQPWTSLTLRVYLEENYALRDPSNPFGGESYYAGMQRFWEAYNTHSAAVSVLTTGSPQSANPTQGQQQVWIHDCRYEQRF